MPVEHSYHMKQTIQSQNSKVLGLYGQWNISVYIYGRKCDVFTTPPHPSGKLACWGLALQELDLQIHYRPGKKNMNADALSRAPTQSEKPFGIIAMLTSGDVQEEDREERDTSPLANEQQNDPELKRMIDYLTESTLPEDETRANKVVLSSTKYTLIDNVLYFSDGSNRLWIVAPKKHRRKLFEDAHSGCCDGHLRDEKVYGQLSLHYWWPKCGLISSNGAAAVLSARREEPVEEKLHHSHQYQWMAPLMELVWMLFNLPSHIKAIVML